MKGLTMTTYTDAERFLQAVFGDDYERFAIFANLNPAVHVRSLDQLDVNRTLSRRVGDRGAPGSR